MAIKVLQNTDYAVSHSDGVKMKGGGVLTDEHKKVMDASISSEDEETIISLFVQNGYWTYENEQPVQNSNANFRYCIIDVTKYDAIKLKMQIGSTYGAKCFFANDNGVKVGDYLYNTTSDFVKFAIPAGATRLYYSSNYAVLASVGARGIKNETALELIDKTNRLLDLTLENKDEAIKYPAVTTGFIFSQGKWSSNSAHQIYLIPYTYQAGDKLSITGGANGAHYVFLTNANAPVANADVPFCTDNKWYITVNNGDTVVVDIPSNCACIFIHKTDVTTASLANKYVPASCKIIRKVIDGQDFASKQELQEIEGRFSPVESSCYDSKIIKTKYWIQGSIKGAIAGTIYKQFTSWDYPKFVPVSGFVRVLVTTGAYPAQIAFVTNTNIVADGAVPFAEGETFAHNIAANTTVEFFVPSNATHMHCSQKVAENRAFPTSVVGQTFAIDNLKDGKQDKVIYIELDSTKIREGYDVVNVNANVKRASISYQECRKGDIVKVTPNDTVGHDDNMLILAFDKNRTQLYRSGWRSEYVITEDGYFSVVLESSASDGGNTELILNGVAQIRYVETALRRQFDEQKRIDIEHNTCRRLLMDNEKSVYTYLGDSPKKNTLTWKSLGKVSPSITNVSQHDINQSLAFFGGYCFIIGCGARMTILDSNFNFVARVNNISTINQVECNASWFSNEYVEESDEFPILYTQAIYTTPYLLGLRIIHNGNSWSVQKVHEINREQGETPWGNLFLYDSVNDDFLNYLTPSGGVRLVRYHRPKYSESENGVSTLSDADIVSSIPVYKNELWQTNPNFAQDNSIEGNIAISISYQTGPTASETQPTNYIFGFDLTKGEVIFRFKIPTLDGFTLAQSEGEGISWYCGRIYMLNWSGYLYELDFNEGEFLPAKSGTSRPSFAKVGDCFFDTSIGKPIWYTGSGWVDANGQSV